MVRLFFIAVVLLLLVGWAIPFLAPEKSWTMLRPAYPGLDDLGANATALLLFALLLAIVLAVLRRPHLAWAVATLAVALRFCMFLATGEPDPIGGDSWAYLRLAENIAAGKGIMLQAGPNFPAITNAVYPPLYSVFLSLPLSLGLSASASVFVVNLACDLLAAWTLWLLAREFGVSSLAIPAIYLLLPQTISGSVIPHKEPLAIAIALNVVLAFARKGRGPVEVVRLGVSTALLAITQPAWVGLTVGLGLLHLLRCGLKKTVHLAVLSGLLCVVVLSPWIIRNYLVMGAAVPMTTSMGFNLYFMATNSMEIAVTPLRTIANEYEASRMAWSLAVADIARDVPGYLRSQAVTFLYSLSIKGWHGYMLGFELSHWKMGLVSARLAQLTDMAIAGIAAWGALKSRSPVAPLLIAAIAGLLSVNFWFELGERHLIFLTPLYLLFISTTESLKAATAASAVNEAVACSKPLMAQQGP